jgi:large subunit ribosomal protein L6
MSRIGKLPIPIPQGVKVKLEGPSVHVEGPKGKLDVTVDGAAVAVESTDGTLVVKRKDDSRRSRGIHGLTRRLLANMVHGVHQGFSQTLEINGVGYRADVAGQKLNMALGFSHPVVFDLPKGVAAKVDKNVVILSGIDKEQLGETASKIRAIRPPEPYKGKGIKYVEETIKRKVGKTGAA